MFKCDNDVELGAVSLCPLSWLS